MYNPYQHQANEENGNQSPYFNGGGNQQTFNLNQQQPSTQFQDKNQFQAQPNQQFSHINNHNNVNNNTQAGGLPFNTFFSDPAAQMGLQFSQSAFNASQQYMQQNLGQFVSNEDIKYYFKVSNSYVLKKLMLILFPYKNKSWIRQSKTDVPNSNIPEIYAPPTEDVNAPDLYIPTMSFLSYILVWALGEGVKGDFHPEMLGYATTRTLAFYLMDFILLRLSFYVLGINSKNSKMWDLVSYTGYKFVPILILLIFKTLTDFSIIVRYSCLLILVFSLGFFMMRSLRYVVLPGGGLGGESKIRLQYLFIYCFLVQGLFVWLMT